MKILIACEFSGIVREAFRKKGHDVWSCDFLPIEIPGNHYQGNVFDIINDGWDVMIAHPPCTYLSNAGARFLFPKGILNKDRYVLGMQAKNFFEKLYNSNIQKICIENPIPNKIFNLPEYSQIIQPYFFGEPYKKATCLWIKNLLLLTVIDGKIIKNPQSTKIAGNWFNRGGKDRQKNRSRTFQGIANAMAEQWGNL
jgi:hypothetical protein